MEIELHPITSIEDHLIGRKVVEASMVDATLTLDNGVKLRFDRDADSCCSWVQLTGLFAADHIITSVRVDDNEDDEGEGEYKAWIQVVTEAGPINIATADGNASNGYYLHGFALGVTVITPDVAP